jgi:hypothetical protein
MDGDVVIPESEWGRALLLIGLLAAVVVVGILICANGPEFDAWKRRQRKR